MTSEAELVLPHAKDGAPEGCVVCADRVATRVRALPGIQMVEVAPEPMRLRYQYENSAVTPGDVERIVRHEMEETEKHYIHRVLAIEGMDCADCAKTLERGIARLPGVGHAEVNFGAARLALEFDRRATSLDVIDKRVRELGYSIYQPDLGVESERHALLRLVSRPDNALTLIAGTLTLVGAITSVLNAPSWMPIVAYLLAVVAGGVPVARKGIRVVKATHSLDINLLMTIAVIGAVAIGEWFEAATVVFLFSLGEALEGYAMDRVRRSVRSLLSLAPSTAIVQRGGVEMERPVSDIQTGELVVVRAGQRIPLDGVVESGASSVDQASLTGESLPVAKEVGDPLFAGTMNGSGPLIMRVTRLAGDSSVARIIRLVENAQAQRAPVQRLVDRFARYYTPAVIAGAIAIALFPPLLGGDWLSWLERALVLLVISCPCALVLSTPISIVSALSAAARAGILIKGGAVLERAGTIDTIAFDKTGTLTMGQPQVTTIMPFGGRDKQAVLALAATLERHSEHPLGAAVIRAAAERSLSIGEARDERVIHGAGLVGTLDGTEFCVGSTRLFSESALNDEVRAAVSEIERMGGTTVLVGTRDTIHGAIGFADTPRENAVAALEDLRRHGISRFVMLSGDHSAAAEDIAQRVGITDVRAGLLPEDKLAAISDLRNEDRVVAMIGDGVNDAPSLAAANIGVAMGVAGSDAAVETADIALMGDDLRGLAQTIHLGHRTRRIIAINITLAIVTKAIFLALAITGNATLWMAIAADMGTSLVVIANGLRLLRPIARPVRA